jgi:hypothetical protein
MFVLLFGIGAVANIQQCRRDRKRYHPDYDPLLEDEEVERKEPLRGR